MDDQHGMQYCIIKQKFPGCCKTENRTTDESGCGVSGHCGTADRNAEKWVPKLEKNVVKPSDVQNPKKINLGKDKEKSTLTPSKANP